MSKPSSLRLATSKDPVCGMDVPLDSPLKHTFQGKVYRFCRQACLDRFRAEPQRYLQPPRPDAVPEGAAFTCPMHPQIIRDGPGSCPICGMALEPMSAATEENPELAEMTRRFWVSAGLTVPLVVLAMGHGLLGVRGPWIQLLLATPVVLWGGWPFLVRGYQSVVHKSLNMFTLIAMGVGVAYVYSVVATLLPGVFPPSLRNGTGGVDVYYEPAAVIVVLVLLGQVLELKARTWNCR